MYMHVYRMYAHTYPDDKSKNQGDARLTTLGGTYMEQRVQDACVV